ncbi:unnamed protein product [Paramecium octaurelia]|uniref:Uncharacterized protein n=1 Tax=Paramecium octaurelia TaxID=43137 RepID=A0A8S1TDM0_PAROT|nr:unnamed protein product [Paramecium octaurelia]CAD8149967.1 unnamed protein product [Paramecium octaurelia]
MKKTRDMIPINNRKLLTRISIKCPSKDRLDHQIEINSNYYAKDVIQSLNKQYYSQKLPIISGIQQQDEEYIQEKIPQRKETLVVISKGHNIKL